jgi:hypothetical protein
MKATYMRKGRRLIGALLAAGCLAIVMHPQGGKAQVRSGWIPDILQQKPTDLEMGVQGENAEEAGRTYQFLPDYSYAGYRWGESLLPEPSGTVVDATEFGAQPNDGQDDTIALRRAVQWAHGTDGPVIVQLPPGRLRLREILFIERGNLVLRGHGTGEEGTTLVVPRPLREMDVPPEYEVPLPSGKSQFSWQGGVIWSRLPARHRDGAHRGGVRAVAGRRDHHVVYLETRANLQPGDVIQLRWYNERREGAGNSLLGHVYCTTEVRFGDNLFSAHRPLVYQSLTVTAVDGRRVTVKEPLLHDVRPDWKVTVASPTSLQEVGIANLRIAFPDVSYAGHLQEDGYNGIFLTDLAHGWVQDVVIENADTPIILDRSTRNLTLQGIDVRGRYGHHGVIVGGDGVLVEDFSIRANFMHTLTFGTGARRSVFTDGYTWMGKLDQHAGGNHQNLFDDIEVQYQREFPHPLFRRGGARAWEPAAGAFNTFWNVQVGFKEDGAGETLIGKIESAPHARIVGLHAAGNRELKIEYGPDPYIEGLNRSGIAVPSLYEYQLDQRLRVNRPPEVAILRPTTGTQISGEGTQTVEAVVKDGAPRPDRVAFYVDREKIGTDTSSEDGWTTQWTASEKGPHSIYAILVDQSGRRYRSASQSCTGGDRVVWVGSELGRLDPGRPNPFSEQTVVHYAIRTASHVRIELFDVQGRMVRVLEEGLKRPGEHTVRIDGSNLSSGVYFYRITAGDYTDVGKSVVVH